MSAQQTRFDDELVQLQAHVESLETLGDPSAREAAREMLKIVLGLHAAGLEDMLSIIREAGTQPADTLIPRLAANPRVCGLMLLHDLHPEDLATRVRKAVDRLRPHLGVSGIRAELTGTDGGVVRIRITTEASQGRRHSPEDVRAEIEDTVMTMAPDASELVIDGLEGIGGTNEVFVPLSSISGRRANGSCG